VELLFGFPTGSIAATVNSVSSALGVDFATHDSLWRGGEYYIYEAGSEKIIIQRNNDGGPPGDPAEEAFPSYPLLMYVESAHGEDRTEQLLKCSSHPVLLRSTED